MRRFKRSNNKKNNARRGKNIVNKPIHSIAFSVPSFYLEQASSGTGGFTTAVSASSVTATNGFSVDPFNIGGSVYQMAAQYSRYRLRKCRLTYIPYSTASGVQQDVTGGTTTPTYVDRAFSVHFTLDPAFSNTGFTSILIGGGRVFNTSRKQSLNLSGGLASNWMYSSTTAASPTAIDLRAAAIGRVEMAYASTSTSATNRFGIFIISGIADYEGLIDRAVTIGLDTRVGLAVSRPPSSETKSSKDENKQQQVKGWF